MKNKILLISFMFLSFGCKEPKNLQNVYAEKDCKITEIYYQTEISSKNPITIGFDFIFKDSISLKKIFLENYPKIYGKLDLPKSDSYTRFSEGFVENFNLKKIPLEEIEEKTKIKIPEGESKYITHATGITKGKVYFSKYLALQSQLIISGFTPDIRTNRSVAYNGKLNVFNSKGESILELNGSNSSFGRILIDTLNNLIGVNESGMKELSKVESTLRIFDLKSSQELFKTNLLIANGKLYDGEYFYYEVLGSNHEIIQILLYDLKNRIVKKYLLPKGKSISGGRLKKEELILYKVEYLNDGDEKVTLDTIQITEIENSN